MFLNVRKLMFLGVILLLASSGINACSSTPKAELHMMPPDQMPPQVRVAPAVVRQAYQFTAANPDLMQTIPCYCGCGAIGHTSNYSCYVAGQDADGGPVWDNHALGCSICVDITQDAMRLLKQGRAGPEIRAYIDETYSRYGPSNIP